MACCVDVCVILCAPVSGEVNSEVMYNYLRWVAGKGYHASALGYIWSDGFDFDCLFVYCMFTDSGLDVHVGIGA